MSETPILDLEQPWPTVKRNRWARFAGLLIGAAIGLLIVWISDTFSPEWNVPGFNGLLLIPAFYIAIAIHEFGHLAAGRLAGIDSGGISVGPIMFARSGDRWIARFDRRLWSGGFFRPLTGPAGVTAARFGFMVAGGPLANLLSALVAGFVWARYGDAGWEWKGTFFWTSVLLLVLALFPMSSGALKSDGARVWQLIRRPDRWPRFAALLSILTEEAKGVRPRDWNADVFEKAAGIDPSAGEYGVVQLFAFYRAVDLGDTSAIRYLEKALGYTGKAPKQFRRSLALEASSVSALKRGDVAHAKEWLGRARAISKFRHDQVAEAAIAMCESRYLDAVSLLAAARERVERQKLDSGLVRFAKERWAEYESICRSHLAAVAAAGGQN